MALNDFQLKNLYRNRHCFNPDNLCIENDYCLKCFAYLLQEDSNVSGSNRWSILLNGEMKIVKSTDVSKKSINANTNEITFKVILETSMVVDQQTAVYNKQNLSSSASSCDSVSQSGSSSRLEDGQQQSESWAGSPSGQDVLPNISIEKQDEGLIVNQNKKMDFCLECNKKLSNPSSLKRHCMRFHTEQKVPQIFCAFCEKNFGGESAKKHLTKHYNLDHQNELCIPLDLKCRICRRGYGNIKLLHNHFTKNHSKKPFQCCHCRKEFSTKDQKTRHLKKSHPTEQSSDLDWAITF